ncbi:secretin [Pasteurellaceae bacterium RH1A]|nr:secretin [Pasteurellaceae bacterium RH1A]
MRRLVILLSLISASLLAQPLSLALKEAPTEKIIAFLAEEMDKNLVIQGSLEQKPITLRLQNSSFEQALNHIAKAKNLTIKKEEDIFYVAQKSQTENPPLLQEIPDFAPLVSPQVTPINSPPKLVTKTVQLHYAKASEVIESLTKGSGNFLSENGYLHFDDRSNQLIIKDSAASLKQILPLIEKLDQPTQQIAIEARIVTISSENLKELGVRWGLFNPTEGAHRLAGSFEGNGLATNNLNVNFPINNAASVALQVATINSRMLDLELTALERENSVEIIASPKLLTTNKQRASIKQGTEIPYAYYNSKDELSELEFREAVLGLEVTPHLSKNNQILLDLIVSQNSPNNSSQNSNQMVTIDKQEINTQVFAQHGQTIVLGGIFQHLISRGEDRVPVLGSIPVIKHLFSKSRDQISKRELVIFVTPYIIKSEPLVPMKKKSKQK